MKTRPTLIQTSIAFALCGALAAPAFAAGQAAAQPAAPAEKQAEKQASKPADKPAGMTVLPGDDFFAYTNGDWLAKTEIPADRGSWSAMGALAEDTNTRIAKMIEELGAAKGTSGEARKVADFYAAYMDEAAIEKRGLAPVKPCLLYTSPSPRD